MIINGWVLHSICSIFLRLTNEMEAYTIHLVAICQPQSCSSLLRIFSVRILQYRHIKYCASVRHAHNRVIKNCFIIIIIIHIIITVFSMYSIFSFNSLHKYLSKSFVRAKKNNKLKFLLLLRFAKLLKDK